jgi:hypothetical protein
METGMKRIKVSHIQGLQKGKRQGVSSWHEQGNPEAVEECKKQAWGHQFLHLLYICSEENSGRAEMI